MTALRWRGPVDDASVEVLHAEAFEHEPTDWAWSAMSDRWSLGWVTCHDGDRLVGFVNVLTDGGSHAWIQDVMVANSHRRRGIGKDMIDLVRQEAAAARCEWLHVDFDDDAEAFYRSCGFEPAKAGLIEL